MQKHLHEPKPKKSKAKAKPKSEVKSEAESEAKSEGQAAGPGVEKEEDRGGALEPERELEGEGSYSAARRYVSGVEEFVTSGRVDRSAREAERAIEGPDKEALREAEEIGKRGEPSNEGDDR